MYSKTTDDIAISIIPNYDEERSIPFDSYYIWSYHVHIENLSPNIVQLINRSWSIINDKGQLQKIVGVGVVGVQPVLNPGEGFEYSSHVHLNSPSGVMLGKYEMTNSNGKLLEVEIPGFSLDCPHIKMSIN